MEDYIGVIIPSLITIIGFFVSYLMIRHSFRLEINKQKISVSLDKIIDLPYRLLSLFDGMMDKQNNEPLDMNKLTKEMKEIFSLIFVYGSKESIIIASEFQQRLYKSNNLNNQLELSNSSTVAYYILLICQFKFDITGEEINPELWYKLRLTDYENSKKDLIKSSNEIVRKLNLIVFFI